MRRVLIACLLAALLVNVAGCWSRKEIDELAVIVAMGFDWEAGPNPYRITMQVARPAALVRGGAAQGQAKGSPVEVVTAVGRTPFEAARYLQQGMPRRFHPQHNEVWIIGQEMARRGIAPLQDFFERDGLARPNMLVLVAKDSAREILKRGQDLEVTLAETITGLIRFRTYTSSTMRIAVNDLGLVMSSSDRQPVIPGISVAKGTVEVGKPMVMLADLAMFRGDRLVGWLSKEENLGFLWMRNKVVRGAMTLPCPGEPGRYLSLDLIRGHSKQRATLVQGRPVVLIHTDLESEMTVQECRQDLATEEGFAQVTAAQQVHVIRSIRQAISAAKAVKSDVLGFGELFHHREPAYWHQVAKKWDDEVFPEVEVRIDVAAHIRRAGMITSPTRRPDPVKEQ